MNEPSISGVSQHQNYRLLSAQRNGEVEVSRDQVVFHPTYAYGTSGVRGNKKLIRGCVAYWEIIVAGKLYGTSVMFGIGTSKVKTKLEWMFADLLGSDTESYGLNHQAIAQHNGLMVRAARTPMPEDNCVVGMLFDGRDGTLSYFVNGQFLCTPFTCIDMTKEYYPMISSTAQQSRFIVQAQKSLYPIDTLEVMATKRVSHLLLDDSADNLPLPTAQKNAVDAAKQRRDELRVQGQHLAQWTAHRLVLPDDVFRTVLEKVRLAAQAQQQPRLYNHVNCR
ncbi:unnamed protein product, partial [Mesorhabditis spiculigera]